MKKSWIISVLMLLCFCAEAQILIVPREKINEANNPRLSKYAGALKFEQTRIQAEQMNEDDGISTFSYSFKNVSRDTLIISKLVSTCSCASASCEKKVVCPDETSEIIVRYNPKGHPGRFERKVFVYVCDDKAPSAILRLAVDVERGADLSGLYPIAMGNIRMRRSQVTFTKGVKAVERCIFVNVADKPIKVDCEKAMLPKCLSYRTEPELVQPGQEGEIVIEYNPSAGGERERMPLMLKGLGVPPSQATINISIKR